MELANIYVLALALAATLLLAFEKAPMAVIGVGLMVGVGAPWLVDPGVAVAGFGNKAVVTIAALYIVGEGIRRTGGAALLANRILAHTGGRETTVVLLIMVMAALLSAFVNNILVVVAFLPVITSICRETGLFPSRLLIPLSYACILGGLTTLVGTSTNLLVSISLEDSGHPALGFFEMTAPGVVLALIGTLYVALIGRHLLPKVPSLAAQSGAAELREYVTEITVNDGSSLIGTKIAEVGAKEDGERQVRVAMVVRDESILRPPFKDLPVRDGDILVIRGHVQELAQLHQDPAHAGTHETERFDPASMSFFELSVSPTSPYLDQPVRDLHLKAYHGAAVFGVMRHGQHIQERVADLRLTSGDVLLVFGSDKARESLRASPNYFLIEGVQEKIFRRERAPIAFLIVLGVITLFVLRVEPVIAALVGALSMVMSGCITARQATRAVNWHILIFIAGMLALSAAMTATGTTRLIGDAIGGGLGDLGSYALVGGIIVTTIILTEAVSNNAVAVMMTPIAIQAAAAADTDPRMLVLAVLFGANTSFANPIGYHTNLIVLGPGGYRFRDYVRVGLGLDVLLAIAATAILPVMFGA